MECFISKKYLCSWKVLQFHETKQKSPNLQDCRKYVSHIPLHTFKSISHIDIFATMKLVIDHLSSRLSKKIVPNDHNYRLMSQSRSKSMEKSLIFGRFSYIFGHVCGRNNIIFHWRMVLVSWDKHRGPKIRAARFSKKFYRNHYN